MNNNMKTNYTPGQILYIQSTENYFYISVVRSMQQHPVVDDVNRREINTCCDLCVDVYSGEMYPAAITFAAGGNSSVFDLDIEFDEIRPVHDFEKKLLFDRLTYKFKLDNPKWMHSFTDSTRTNISDWLCWKFNVDIHDDKILDTAIPETIYEITNYIWDALCKEVGNYPPHAEYVKLEMVNKQEFIAKVKRWLELETDWNMKYVETGRNDNYGKIDELVKYLEA